MNTACFPKRFCPAVLSRALVFAALAIAGASGAAAQATSYKFDFGAATSAAGYLAVDNTATYNATRGYGWTATTGLLLRDRGVPEDLRRDFVFNNTVGATLTFRVSGLPAGRYLMKVLCGDASYGDHVITVSVPGAGTLPTMAPKTGQYLQLSATVTHTGTLDITFSSTANNWVVNALTLEPAAADITPFVESSPVSEWQSSVFSSDPTTALINAFAGATTGNFQSTGLTRADYLRLIASEIDFWKTKQNSSGALIDPYANSEIQYSTPAFAQAAGVLVAYAGRSDLIEPAAKAMDWATARLKARLAAGGHEDFYPPMLAHGLMLLKPYVTATRAATWESNLNYDPYAIYRQAMGSMNWNIVSSCGEALLQKLGIRPASNGYVAESWAAQGRHFTSPYGLYMEGPMPYDHFPRIFLADAIEQGYTGPYSTEVKQALGRAAIASLFMQSPWGELPAGGRSAHHQWNEAEQCVTYEIYAAKAEAAGDLRLAAAYKRGAHLALSSMFRWVRPSGEMQVVKNWVNPASRHAYESYSYHSQYNLLPMAMLATAYEYAASSEDVAEQPAPADTGGFVFHVPGVDKVFANAGGTYVELDTIADTHYDATGLNRVHVKGVPPQLGPSDSLLSSSSYTSPNPSSITTGVGVSWKDSTGAWRTLGQMSSTEITSVTMTPISQAPSRVVFDVVYSGSLPGVSSITERYTVTPDGVQLATKLAGYTGALRYVWPVLSNDGQTASTINVIGNTVWVSQGGVPQTFRAPGAQSVRVEATAYSNHNGWARLGVAEYPNGGEITLLISQLSPTAEGAALFSDGFGRDDSTEPGRNDNGLGGTLTASYAKGGDVSISSGRLSLNGPDACVTPRVNFTHGAISSGGGMDIEFDCNPVSDTATNGAGWIGVTLGQSAPPTGAAYNTSGTGKDFSLLVRDNGAFHALSTGATVVAADTVFDLVPAPAEPESYHVKLRVTTSSFAAGSPFVISATITGELDATPGPDTATLDLNGAAEGTDYAGVWTGEGNYLTFESDGVSTLDNLKISAPLGGNTAYWKGDLSSTWSANVSGNTNWTEDAAGAVDPALLPDGLSDVVFSATGASGASATQLGADVAVRGLTVNGSGAVGIGGTHSLSLGVNGITLAAGAGALNIATTGQLVLAANQSWSNASANSFDVSSVISGDFGLTKAGSGGLVLKEANTYSGATTVAGGTLRLDGSLAGALTVEAGALLTGTGSVSSASTVRGSHRPGSGVGSQTFAALSYGSAARLEWELSGNSVDSGLADRVVAGGPVSISDGARLDIVLNRAGSGVALNDAFWKQPRSWALVSTSALTGSFTIGDISLDPAGRDVSAYGSFSLAANADGLNLVFTPLLTPDQAWRQAWFGDDWNTSSVSGDAADPDGDGVPNLLERAFGGNPTVAENQLTPAADPAAPLLSIVYRRALAASDLTFTVQESADLSADGWANAAGSDEVLSNDGAVQLIRFTAPMGGAARKFLRVQVSQE